VEEIQPKIFNNQREPIYQIKFIQNRATPTIAAVSRTTSFYILEFDNAIRSWEVLTILEGIHTDGSILITVSDNASQHI